LSFAGEMKFNTDLLYLKSLIINYYMLVKLGSADNLIKARERESVCGKAFLGEELD
jgi:hypothetical protein